MLMVVYLRSPRHLGALAIHKIYKIDINRLSYRDSLIRITEGMEGLKP